MNVHITVYTIGALARDAGVSAPTIRFYEGIGLLPTAQRTPAGQRNYAEADLSRLTFIKQCRDFGFTIDQVRVLLDLSVSKEKDCTETRDIAQAHLDEVRAKLADLRRLETRLEGFVQRCDEACAGGAGRDCVIFKEIASGDGRGCCG
ncbi:helix-turn-helix domain-containing protein [Sinorhizobium meliloti]|uniref:MerR family transcriptional regulator n=1 Tax=Rhizobium meliloti TaxID=382 RepID=UPI00299D728D|nr:MerR family DNA-binding protein [Sinorhizobium meliloti]